MFPEQRVLEDRRVNPERRMTPSVIAASLLQRLSWHAVGLGTLLSLALQVCLFVLGMALGVYNPAENRSLVTTIGIWEIIMTVGSLVPAGYIGARTAGIPSRVDSALHGVFIWALTVLSAPFLGGRIGVASAFAIPADLQSALWAFCALAAGLTAATLSAWYAAPHVNLFPRRASDISTTVL